MLWIVGAFAEGGRSPGCLIGALAVDLGARAGYAYAQALMVVGVIVFAVGVEQAIAHPSGDTSAKIALVMLGGPAIYLAGTALFKFSLWRRAPWLPDGAGGEPRPARASFLRSCNAGASGGDGHVPVHGRRGFDAAPP